MTLEQKDKEKICKIIVEMAEKVYHHVPKMILSNLDKEYLYKSCIELWEQLEDK